jgi:glycosyltransferase involved in cell wall biosynthesis
MRVLHLANGNIFGGIETFLVTLARLEHSNGGIENHFLLSHRGRLSTELEEAGATPVFVEGVRMRHPWSVLRARRECRARVQTLKPDVVMAHGLWAYVVFGQGLPLAPPLVVFQHGAAIADALHRLASLRAPAGVIANSPYTASTTATVFPGVPVRVCRYPVVPSSPRRARDLVRAELTVREEPVIVQTSRLEPWKGQRLLLEALTRLPEIPWRLWLAGGHARPAEARFRDELEAFTRSHGLDERVTFLGERNDISDVLAAADIFCQPNIEREPYGISVVEAMSAGLPIVATKLGATADGVGPEIGRCVDPDPMALSDALRELLTDREKRIRLGSAAREHFNDNFSPAAALRDLGAALDTISSSSSTSRPWA